MHQPTAPIIPILNKWFLFVHTPSDPQNPSRRYLQCPATGHLYCTSTGSLYQKTIISLSAKSSPLLSINSGLLPCNSSAYSQSISEPTAKKEKKKSSRKTKNKSVPILDNSSATTKKKASVLSKKKKSTVTPQPKSTPSFVFIRNSFSSLKKPASITQTVNQCKAVIHPDNNLSEKNTKKSHIYYTVYLHHMVKFIQPIRINFEDLLFPQNVFLKHELTKFSRKRAEENIQIVQKHQGSPKRKRRRKPPSLCLSNEEYVLLCSGNIFKEKTEKKKKLGPLFQVFKFKTAGDILTMIGNDLY
ncbi:uncharacterized protein LOC122936004 [Bufo gargarizans]|uniref:uncharacterized protein LOC122936004 n=1 Tax=Bufo gargarizans TaxID=30331 RepID=UPI001CF5AA6B|nr:uncharacterized protein LOC122936004 [Bufo gargarizans]XP_044147929.1 uncharacterized protein LOC122936004 [Bufo gargarizans]